MPVLAPLAGPVNNDDLAFLGGTVATLGAWQLVATGRDGWLALAFCGVLVAAWAKLTGLLLTVPMLSCVMAYMLWQKRLPWTWMITGTLVMAAAPTPFLQFIPRHGRPTPP